MTKSVKIKAAFAVAVALRLGVGIAMFLLAVQWGDNSHGVNHVDDVIERLEQLSLDAGSAESYARRFVETRGDPDLARCREELNRTKEREGELENLVADFPAQRKSLLQIRILVGQKVNTIQRSLASGATASGDPSDVREALASLDRAGTASDLRAAILEMETEERQLLRADIAWQEKTAALSRILFLVTSFCALNLIVFAGWRIAADWKKRDAIEKKLAAKEEQYRKLVELAGDFICRTDDQGRFTFSNEAALASLHFSRAEVIGRSYLKLVRQDKRRAAERFYARQFARRQKNSYYEFPIIDGHGREIWVGQNVQLILQDGKVAGFQAIAREITARKHAEFELQKSRNFVERIAATTPGILYVYDLVEHRNVYNNCEVAGVLGCTPEEFQGMGSIELVLVHPDDRARVRTHHEGLRHALDGEVRRIEFRARHADGHWVWLASRDTAFERGTDGLVKQVVGISQDISASRAVQEKLAYQANYDALTGLSNRNHFWTGLQSALRRSGLEMSVLSVCLFDVDRFKEINDRFGHSAGDEVLESIGSIVRTELRSGDFAGRLGGDEFCFALPGADKEECARVAERIRERLDTLAFGMASGSAFSVSATFGVAESAYGMDAKKLMEAADQTLYRAKAAGRNRVMAGI